MYNLYDLKHHTVEMLPCGTDGQTTSEDSATQLEALSLAKTRAQLDLQLDLSLYPLHP